MPALKHTLFIAFDGLTDPLGRSQILPYLIGISKKGYHITVLSCEKPERLKLEKSTILALIANETITWNFILYNEAGSTLSRFGYVMQLHQLAKAQVQKENIGLVHCRSYLAALIGLHLKKKKGIPFLFDMRGFWVDERIDGGIWNRKRPLHRWLYTYFKRKETAFYKHADTLVSLTHAGLKDMQQRFPQLKLEQRTHIIPCCTDLKIFNPAAAEKEIKKPIVNENDHVIVYAGSIGTWYYTHEMIACLRVWKQHLPTLKLLVLTKDTLAWQRLLETYPPEVKTWMIQTTCTYQQMPLYLSLAKAAFFFIKPAYSKIASSPTKMAECWAMNLPIITNSGIGDNDLFFNTHKGGVLVDAFTDKHYQLALEQYLVLLQTPTNYRQLAQHFFDTETAIKTYVSIYDGLTQH